MKDERPADEVQAVTDAPEQAQAAAGPQADPQAGEAWRAVIAQLDDLGEAIGRWARAAVNDPNNKARAQELKTHIERIGAKVGDTLDDAAESDAAQGMKDAAERAGDAIKDLGQRIGEEAFPRMASAFETAAAKLHEAASKMEGEPEHEPEHVYDETDAARDVTL